MSADTAVELRKYGVSVVSIWPGLVQTEMIVDAAQQGQLSLERTPKVREKITFLLKWY